MWWHLKSLKSLWYHNERDGVSNHQCLNCLLNSLFRCRSRNIKTPRHWPLWGESTGDWRIPLTKGQPVTQKMFLFDDVITFHCNVKEIDIELTHICQHQLCINNFWYHLAHNISRKANNISRKVITPEIRHFLRHISWRCGRKTKLPSHKLCLWMLWICFYIKYFLTLLALCEGNPLVTGGFPSQKTSNA